MACTIQVYKDLHSDNVIPCLFIHAIFLFLSRLTLCIPMDFSIHIDKI